MHLWLLLVFAVGLALRLFALSHSPELLTDKTLPDDAFYYYEVARNISNGLGVTFDGASPTNGFHPLWMILVTPFYLLFSDDLAIQGSLVLSSLFDMFAAWMAFRIVRRLTGNPWAGLFTAAIYYVNPIAWIFSINGLETSVGIAVISLLTDRVLHLDEQESPGYRDFLIFGVLAGLAVLARTDNSLLVICAGLFLLYRGRRKLGARIGQLTAAAGVSALVTAPWFVWNYLTFGEIVQTSGTALPLLERTIFAHGLGGNPEMMTYVRHTIGYIWGSIRWTLVWSGMGNINLWDGGILPLILLFVAFVVPLSLAPATRADLGRRMGRLTFLFVFIALLFTSHTAVRWVYREWYTIPITWTIMVGLGISWASFQERLWNRQKWGWSLHVWMIVLVAAMGAKGLHIWRNGIYVGQSGLIRLANFTGELPLNAELGLSDSGIVGYYSPRQVVNLDGIVNNEASAAIQEGQLLDYIRSACIDYIDVQPRYMIEPIFGPNFRDGLVYRDGNWYRVLDGDRGEACAAPPDVFWADLGIEEGRRFLGDGWGMTEAYGIGIWAVSTQAQLQFDLPQPDAGAYRLRVRAMPFQHAPEADQAMDLTINGTNIGGYMMDRGIYTVYEFAIPPGVIVSSQNTLTFSFAGVMSPAEAGVNADTRTLAVRVDYIELMPEDDIAESTR